MKTVQQNYNSLKKKKLRQILLMAIDESLSSLGDSARQAIYYHLESSFNLKKAEIPEKIEVFSKVIEDIFRDGAKLLEIQIMRNLHEKIKCGPIQYPSQSELIFAEYIEAQISHAMN